MKIILTCAALVLTGSTAWSQTPGDGHFQSSIDGRVFEVRTRQNLEMDLYDTSGKLVAFMKRSNTKDDFKGETHVLAEKCPNQAGKIETTDVAPDRISMRVELPNTSMVGDIKGDKSTGCFKFGFVRWQTFALVRTAPPKAVSAQPGASAPPPTTPPAQTAPVVQRAEPAPAKTTPETAPPAPISKPPVIEARGFSIAVDTCRRSGSSVVCKLVLTNKDARRDTQLIAGSSRFITTGNVAYTSSEVVLAGVRNRLYSQATLLPTLPADGELIFENVPPSVTTIHFLELSMWASNVGHFVVPYPATIPVGN
jgi:hypothetical protein